MDFQVAVKTCLSKFREFTGRARRPEYWWFALFVYAGAMLTGLFDRLLFGPDLGVFGVIWGLAMILPWLAANVRRMHDLDKSGWWLLLGLIPIVGVIVLIYWFAQPGSHGRNRYGSEPRVRATVV